MYSLETRILKVIGFVFEKFLLFLEMPPSPHDCAVYLVYQMPVTDTIG